MDSGDTLSERVAEEIRALLARRRVTGRELARRLSVSSPWVSQRLTGHTEIGVNDLERIATALDVEITALLPTRINKTYSPPPVRATGPRSTRTLLAPGHTGGRHPTGRGASAMSGATPADVRRPAITGHTHSGSTT
jgi:DNA-binding transcriptional regulator YdaS (Cro superfamily)